MPVIQAIVFVILIPKTGLPPLGCCYLGYYRIHLLHWHWPISTELRRRRAQMAIVNFAVDVEYLWKIVSSASNFNVTLLRMITLRV